MSNLTREVNHTDPTSQIACQQIAEDRTPIAIPPTPVIDVDAALSESEVPNEIQYIFSLCFNVPDNMMSWTEVLQLLEKLSQVHVEK
ncbi:hypothetical protein Bca101_026894 [Brassica carinata]